MSICKRRRAQPAVTDELIGLEQFGIVSALISRLGGPPQAPVVRDGVENHLCARDGVDERIDELVEPVEKPGEVCDDRRAETFWVVRLEDVEDLSGGGEAGIFGLVCVVDHERERPVKRA